MAGPYDMNGRCDAAFDRRTFMAISAAVASAGTAGAAGTASRPALDGAARIGWHLLRVGALGTDAAALRAELGLGRTPVRAAFTRNWQARIREDFRAGRTLDAAGWTLSRTEGALCALAALDARGAVA